MLEQRVPLEEIANRVQEFLEQRFTGDVLGADAVDLDVHSREMTPRVDQEGNDLFHARLADTGKPDLADAAGVRVGGFHVNRDEPIRF